MNFINDIKLQEKDEFNMIIEIERGSKLKNELVAPSFDKVECVRKCKLKYPFYYGCFPQTLAGDGDPADAILLTAKKHKTLDVVRVMPVAIIRTLDNGEEDNKIICIDGSIKYVDKLIKIVDNFLHVYKGKKADMVIDPYIGSGEDATKELLKSHKMFKDANRNASSILEIQ